MKLANWNVMLPVALKRREAIREYIDLVNADVWVFTEMHDGCETGFAHAHSSATGRDGKHGSGHRWVTIASKFPLEALLTSDPERTAACRVTPPRENPFIVYGNVLPWKGSQWRGYSSNGGEAFRESLAFQKSDWSRLRIQYPEDELFIMGDFNQGLIGSQYYGSKTNRDCLEAAFAETGIVPLTGGDNDPIFRDSAPCACIDHICMRIDSGWSLECTERWPDTAYPVRSLSDHFGVSVTLFRRN